MGPQPRAVCCLFFLLQSLAEPTQDSDFHLEGDYLLGGLFSLHANVKDTVHLSFLQVPQCKEYEMKVLGYNLMQAMRFAVEEINNHSALLPGVRLGYEMVDICYNSNSIQPVLYFLAQEDDFLPIQEDYSQYVPRVVAVVGPDSSESTITVAHLLSLLLLPQITYSAISDRLLDKQLFPALLRTVAGADHHVEAMVQLMVHFGWNWVIVLVSGDDYGRENSQLLSERLAQRRICVAFHEVLPTPQPGRGPSAQERRRLEAIADKLWLSTARVVAVLAPDLALHGFFRVLHRRDLTGTVWIASESWAIDPVLHSFPEVRRAGTFLGITTRSVPIPGFSEFRLRREARAPAPGRPGTCNQECAQCHGAAAAHSSILTLSGERAVYSVYAAVYAVAHALHAFLRCTQTRCPKAVVYPWRLLQEIKKVNFTLLGHQVFFNHQGDLPLSLDIVQWHWDTSHNPFRSVASYCPVQRQLKLLQNISWQTPNNRVPLSTCSKDCEPGQIKKPVGIHPCCFQCLDCLPGTFLNKTADEYDCQPCPRNMWSHRKDTSCFPRRLAFLRWHEAPTILVATLAALGFLGTLAALLLFGRHVQTPVVRSAGGNMCFLMLVPLLGAYALVPLYVGLPTVPACLSRQALVPLCLTLCISCTAVRSFQIVCVFRVARRLPRAYGCWVRYHGPYLFVALTVLLKMATVAGSVLSKPTDLSARADPGDPQVLILACNPSYGRGLLANSGLDLLLSVLGFCFAYAGKELPTSYNEAKFITFCMTFYFASSVFLCTLMSVYEGVLVTFLDLLVTVLNLLCFTLGFFGPKCHTILFHPERNTQAYFNSIIQGYTMGRD
ncbi:taste receptor type 1 member 2 [Sorex araneus]|uniref:taste receptor type 1 member 2 n=1 Tax=Sorex araneus TaxID=42254 RepID=UPI0024340202|nr:taste receptor type 1 member 2 [Sorex araneus]